MNSSYRDSCFVDSNTCPSTANSTGCSHFKDVTIECSKLDKSFLQVYICSITYLTMYNCMFIFL